MLRLLLCTIIVFSIVSVYGQNRKSVYYSQPLTGKTYDLSKILGTAFEMMYRETESVYVVKFDQASQKNVILNSCYDTVFSGQVFKVENLFFLQRQFGENKYQITALCLGKNTIRGLGDMNHQILTMEEMVNTGKYKELIAEQTNDEIRLKPIKEIMPGIYDQILNKFEEAVYTENFKPCSKDGSDYCN